jgi:hypothetical protein
MKDKGQGYGLSHFSRFVHAAPKMIRDERLADSFLGYWLAKEAIGAKVN